MNKKHYGITSSDFLQNHFIAYTLIGRVKTTKGITPPEGSAIDINKHFSLRKAYEENLERKKIGLQMDDDEMVEVFDIIQKKIKLTRRSDFGYGFNDKYGYVDTTGTVSGISSRDAIYYSVLEIIEKNEMMLFWYKSLGSSLVKNQFINNQIKKMNYSSEKVEVFRAKNLTNFPVYFVILISDHKIVASGAGIAESEWKSLEKALKEARLLEWQNKNNPLSNLNNLPERDTIKYINYIEELKNTCNKISFIDSEYHVLELPDWLTSLDYHVLNRRNDYSSLTVKCLSPDLINCLPVKENLLKKGKLIYEKYGLTLDILVNSPNCFLL